MSTQAAAASTEIVLFPVERRFLRLVTEVIAKAYDESDQGGEGQLPVIEWNEEDLRALNKMLPERHVARAILDLGSTSSSGVALEFENVVSQYGQLRNETARAQLAGLTRRVKKEFGRSNWPFDFEWSSSGKATYTVDEQVARRWQKISK